MRLGLKLVVGCTLLAACGGAKRKGEPQVAPVAAPPPPAWVTHLELEDGKLCGVGVAGAGFDEHSPYPRQLSRERAVRNLAGVLGTSVAEAIVDRETNSGSSVELARTLHVDEDLVRTIDQLATVEYWLDRHAVGPFAQKGFTYACVCVDAAKAAARFAVAPEQLARAMARSQPAVPRKVPGWMSRSGKQPGGRLCAIGFSLPMFFADNTFEAVVEDIRAQLAEVIETLVSSYSEDILTDRFHTYELMTVASTQAIAKGVIVTDFWYDRDGIGLVKQPRSTYGWGCVYPVDILQQSIDAVAGDIPAPTVAKVRERAASAFEELDTEVAKRETAPDAGPAGALPAGPEPSSAPSPAAADAPAPSPGAPDGAVAGDSPVTADTPVPAAGAPALRTDVPSDPGAAPGAGL